MAETAVRPRKSWNPSPRTAAAWMFGAGGLLWAGLFLATEAPQRFSHGVLGILGVIALWRYGWGLVHLVRALIYLHVVYPRLRARADDTAIGAKLRHVYAVVCSYQIPDDQFRAVYASLIRNCVETGLPATIVAAVTSDRDFRILATLLEQFGQPAQIRIIVQYQEGSGKRDAMAMALRAIAREQPPLDSATLMLDGDVVLAPGALRSSLAMMAADPGLAALTTNNDCVLDPADPARHWYRLRFAQRHLLMSSLALSGRLLVLTGRFSLYRTPDAINPGFIDIVERDAIDSWLHGRVRLLSGDDKSIWYYLLRRGGKMAYLPDVRAVSFEAMPDGEGFFGGSTRLMQRWFGNMLRANGRALALGPWRCRPFLWWCLLDQRISSYTTLLGLSGAVLLSVLFGPIYLVIYCAWLLLTRTVLSGIYGALWGHYHPSWPAFLAYAQVWGSMLKLQLQFHSDRQNWTRQHIASAAASPVSRLAANGMHGAALLLVVVAAALLAYASGRF